MRPVSFSLEQQPECSIVVLAWHLTTELVDSLASVAASVDAPAFEVVVVLNGANDDVRQAVHESVTGATIVDLAFNVGFGGGCNAGAAQARGEYLVFLNDDTLVDANWLGELYRSARRPSDSGLPVGAVVSRLLNVDGTVQEAGSRMLPTRGTVQFGAGLSVAEAADAGLLKRRRVDYGSGAALLVVASVFRELGGFDPLYEPAYYEDVDLQFRIRSAGYEVLFEPDAIVTHLSGGSTNSSANSLLFREWAGAHASLAFQDRWAEVLTTAPSEDAPLDALCIVPAVRVAGTQSVLPTAEQIAAGAAVSALAMSAQYAQWLVDRLERVTASEQHLSELYDEAERGRVEYAERITRESIAYGDIIDGLNDELAAARGEADEARGRLHDLDQRSLLGVLKWRAGVIRSRRRSS